MQPSAAMTLTVAAMLVGNVATTAENAGSNLSDTQRGRRAGCNDGVDGECIDVSTHSCHGTPVLTGKCPGSASIMCCPTPGEPYEGKIRQDVLVKKYATAIL